MAKRGRPKKSQFELEGNWLNDEEAKEANKIYESYLKANHFDSVNDKELLKRLVFAIINSKRIEKELTSKYLAGKEDPKRMKVSTHLNKAYNDSLSQIMDIQKQLGIIGDKDKQNPLKHIFKLMKKFKKWKEENQDGRTVVCPFCKKLFFLNIRTDKYEAMKHPYFHGKILGNKNLWKLYKQGKIDKKELAEVLNTSVFYIDWLEEKIYNK